MARSSTSWTKETAPRPEHRPGRPKSQGQTVAEVLARECRGREAQAIAREVRRIAREGTSEDSTKLAAIRMILEHQSGRPAQRTEAKKPNKLEVVYVQPDDSENAAN